MAGSDPIAATASSAIALLVAAVSPPDVMSAVTLIRPTFDEHEAGRRAAASAVAAIGAAGGVSGPRGVRPSWPPDLVGSISHTRGWAAAVVAHSARYDVIGLDVEVCGALPAEDAVAVCSAPEQSVLASVPIGPDRDALATVHWAAKEAAFKAWDPWCDGALWGVDPALLAVELGTGGVTRAHPAPELADRLPGLPHLSGRWAGADGLVAVVLAARRGPACWRPDDRA